MNTFSRKNHASKVAAQFHLLKFSETQKYVNMGCTALLKTNESGLFFANPHKSMIY
jgi:hypothetical protein